MENPLSQYRVRNLQKEDFLGVIQLCQGVYPTSPSWAPSQLESHLNVFPEGQIVIEDSISGRIVAYAASLIVSWDEYDNDTNWRDFTDSGMFTNHDPEGMTLYGAEVMVAPDLQGHGLGKMIYAARDALVRRLGLLRIRAGARLRGFARYADQMSVEEYVQAVVRGEIGDSTLSFQLKRGFQVLAVTRGYLRHDPESLGYAAVIEWLNPEVAEEKHFQAQRRSRFYRER